jgi:hypothetical protein
MVAWKAGGAATLLEADVTGSPFFGVSEVSGVQASSSKADAETPST